MEVGSGITALAILSGIFMPAGIEPPMSFFLKIRPIVRMNQGKPSGKPSIELLKALARC